MQAAATCQLLLLHHKGKLANAISQNKWASGLAQLSIPSTASEPNQARQLDISVTGQNVSVTSVQLSQGAGIFAKPPEQYDTDTHVMTLAHVLESISHVVHCSLSVRKSCST